ncbi:MAG: hypothetical protein JNG86_12875 [Verrucomicrobiaceae bacterium]|nr:hypothetical protein [Verrucomicrobiaceae bacterium]
MLLTLATIPWLLFASDTQVIKQVKDGTQRGTLSDQRQLVRGDTGKWNDAAMLLHTTKPQGMPPDDWMDEAGEKKPAVTATDENWLLFRTRQLDDNDRVWIEKIERSGNAFTITMHEAIWQGKYFKTFTWYEVTAVNLGKLPAGDYTVTWIVKPLVFKQLEKPREAQNNYQTNWPVDDQPGEKKPVELKTKFTVQ